MSTTRAFALREHAEAEVDLVGASNVEATIQHDPSYSILGFPDLHIHRAKPHVYWRIFSFM
jgi:hypothetical protein